MPDEDQELLALQKAKKKLLEKAHQLIEEWKVQRQTGCKRTISINSETNRRRSARKEEHALGQRSAVEDEARLCQVSRQISGIDFNDVDRKWLKDDLYLYTALVETKAIQFYLELTIELKEKEEFEVMDVTCHFVNQDAHCLTEIQSWVQSIAKAKNFSLLMSAVSQYSEHKMVRAKIIQRLEAEGYATPQGHSGKKGGGVLLNLHPPNKKAEVYFKLHWSISFLENTWHIEHLFSIDPTKRGRAFAEKQKVLLLKFCKIGLEKDDLVKLWAELCNALDSLGEVQCDRESTMSDNSEH